MQYDLAGNQTQIRAAGPAGKLLNPGYSYGPNAIKCLLRSQR